MINNKICTIFDDIFEDNITKKNYLTYYKFIYDVTCNDNTYDIELIKNSILINYQKLCIKYCEQLNNCTNDNFLNEYYYLYNKTLQHNETFNKIFSYFLKVSKDINPINLLKNNWGVFIVKPNINKISDLYLQYLNLNDINEIGKITNNFKNNLDVFYYTILNEIYIKYTKLEIKKLIGSKDVNQLIAFFSKISIFNKLYLHETVSKVENEICIKLIKNNINIINDSLQTQHDLLLKYIEEIAITNFNVFPKFDSHIDLVNEYHKIIQKYDNKFFTEKIVKLFDALYSDNILEIFKNFNIKVIITYIDFIDALYDNLNIENDFMKDFDRNMLNKIHVKNIKRLNLNDNFIKLLLKYINQNITESSNNLNQLGILVSSIENKELFGEMYKKLVVRRLITPKKVNIENERLYLNKLIFKYEIDSASRVFRILDDYTKSLQNTKEFVYINNINSRIINATYDMWDIKEDTNKKLLSDNFSKKYNQFKSKYEEYYNCRYENRELKWCDNFTSCVINFNGNELLCSLKQADILSLFNEEDTINIEKYNFEKNILDSLVISKILILKNNLLSVNDKIKVIKSLNIMKFLKSSESSKNKNLNKVRSKLLWDKETYIDSFIMRYLKKEHKCTKEDLFNITFKKYENYQISNEFFEKRISRLEEQHYIKTNGNELCYVP